VPKSIKINAQADHRHPSGASTQRAWQALPRHLRRRAASHDVRRVPVRLREKAKAEVNDTIGGTICFHSPLEFSRWIPQVKKPRIGSFPRQAKTRNSVKPDPSKNDKVCSNSFWACNTGIKQLSRRKGLVRNSLVACQTHEDGKYVGISSSGPILNCLEDGSLTRSVLGCATNRKVVSSLSPCFYPELYHP
jgi:hypothetical protein